MADMTQPQGLPLWSDFTRFARRHALAIVTLMVAGLVAGFAWSLQQPSTYSATTSVYLTPVPKYVTPSTLELVAAEVTIDTDAQLLRSPEVLTDVADVLGTTPEQAFERLTLTASPNTHVLHVTVTSSSPALAAEAADAAVASFIQVRRASLGALQGDQLLQLRNLIIAQENQLADEQASHLILPATDPLFADLLELRAGLDELTEAYDEPARVVQPAATPTAADYANTEVPLVSGTMLGLLGACVLGTARDRLRRRVHESGRGRLLPHLSGHLRPVTITLHEDTHHA